jgi:hypothetical protein
MCCVLFLEGLGEMSGCKLYLGHWLLDLLRLIKNFRAEVWTLVLYSFVGRNAILVERMEIVKSDMDDQEFDLLFLTGFASPNLM